MNHRCPSAPTAANGREPLDTTSAGQTESAGRPAARSASAIPSAPIRRSGTPNATRTAAPTVSPVAKASSSSIGSAVPVTSRTTTIRSSVSQAARRHGRLSQGEAATITAAAAANSGGPGNAALASHEPRARLVRQRSRMPAAEQEQDPGRDPGRAQRRPRPARAAGGTGGARAWPPPRAPRRPRTRPARCRSGSVSGPDPRPPATGAAEPRSQRRAAAEATSDTSSSTPPAISRITSPGCRYREDGSRRSAAAATGCPLIAGRPAGPHPAPARGPGPSLARPARLPAPPQAVHRHRGQQRAGRPEQDPGDGVGQPVGAQVGPRGRHQDREGHRGRAPRHPAPARQGPAR